MNKQYDMVPFWVIQSNFDILKKHGQLNATNMEALILYNNFNRYKFYCSGA